jgi:hypothetical protein
MTTYANFNPVTRRSKFSNDKIINAIANFSNLNYERELGFEQRISSYVLRSIRSP